VTPPIPPRARRVDGVVGLAHERIGDGPPLLLLHAFGLSRRAWKPVIPLLAGERELLLVDLPGHGDSPMPPAGTAPNPAGYAREIGRLLDELGIETIAVCGNSIGGWTALELAKLGRADSVAALSPAGLWPTESLYRRIRFVTDHYAIRASRPVARAALRRPRGRRLFLRDVLDRPERPDNEDAWAFAEDFAAVKELPAHLRAWRGQRFEGGSALTIPVTVAWGARDRLMPPSRRSSDQLPRQARWFEVPGCGHLMAWDAPDEVAETILEAVQPSRSTERQASRPSAKTAAMRATPGR
jgi:pimeloyl-ACP methyl ester carboxylesterase